MLMMADGPGEASMLSRAVVWSKNSLRKGSWHFISEDLEKLCGQSSQYFDFCSISFRKEISVVHNFKETRQLVSSIRQQFKVRGNSRENDEKKLRSGLPCLQTGSRIILSRISLVFIVRVKWRWRDVVRWWERHLCFVHVSLIWLSKRCTFTSAVISDIFIHTQSFKN